MLTTNLSKRFYKEFIDYNNSYSDLLNHSRSLVTFINGGVGVGKTTLVHHYCSELLKTDPKSIVQWINVTSDDMIVPELYKLLNEIYPIQDIASYDNTREFTANYQYLLKEQYQDKNILLVIDGIKNIEIIEKTFIEQPENLKIIAILDAKTKSQFEKYEGKVIEIPEISNLHQFNGITHTIQLPNSEFQMTANLFMTLGSLGLLKRSALSDAEINEILVGSLSNQGYQALNIISNFQLPRFHSNILNLSNEVLQELESKSLIYIEQDLEYESPIININTCVTRIIRKSNSDDLYKESRNQIFDNLQAIIKQLKSKKEYEQSLLYTKKIITCKDESEMIYYKIAKLYYKLLNFPMAKEYITKAKKMPKSDNTWKLSVLLGRIDLKIQRSHDSNTIFEDVKNTYGFQLREKYPIKYAKLLILLGKANIQWGSIARPHLNASISILEDNTKQFGPKITQDHINRVLSKAFFYKACLMPRKGDYVSPEIISHLDDIKQSELKRGAKHIKVSMKAEIYRITGDNIYWIRHIWDYDKDKFTNDLVIENLEKALEIYLNCTPLNTHKILQILCHLCVSHSEKGNFQETIDLGRKFQTILTSYKTTLSIAEEELNADVLYLLGHNKEKMGIIEISHFEQSFALYDKFHKEYSYTYRERYLKSIEGMIKLYSSSLAKDDVQLLKFLKLQFASLKFYKMKDELKNGNLKCDIKCLQQTLVEQGKIPKEDKSSCLIQ